MRQRLAAAAFAVVGLCGASASAQDVVVPTEGDAIRRLSERLNVIQARLDERSAPTSARAHIDFVAPLPSADPDARLFLVAGWGFACSDIESSDIDRGRPQILVDGVELNVEVTRVERTDVAAAYPPWYCWYYGGGTIPKYAGIMAVVDLRSVLAVLKADVVHKVKIRVYDQAWRAFDSANELLELPLSSLASKVVSIPR